MGKFSKVIKRAMIACENSGHDISYDFPEIRKIVAWLYVAILNNGINSLQRLHMMLVLLQMIQDFGKGFTVANLKYMRQFYLTFPNGHALRDELSWTHFRLLMKMEIDNAREFYIEKAIKSQWSTRQLERQINSFFYEWLLSSKNKEQAAEGRSECGV